VVLGRYSDVAAARLRVAIKNQNFGDGFDAEFDFYEEYEGVFNAGDQGQFGEEGIIEYSGAVEIPRGADGRHVDGLYLVLLSLTKASVTFEFTPPRGAYNKKYLTEVSVPVRLPAFIEHDLYGHPDFNIIIGFKYRGNPITEYEGNLENRDSHDLTAVIGVECGEPRLIYRRCNGVET
jgi:hypothetical protein